MTKGAMNQKFLLSCSYSWSLLKEGAATEENARYWKTIKIPNTNVSTIKSRMYKKVITFDFSI